MSCIIMAQRYCATQTIIYMNIEDFTMFIPFLIALGTAITAIYKKKVMSYALWTALLAVIILTFNHHATSVLNLSF